MEEDKFSNIDDWSKKIKGGCDPAINSLLAVHFESQNDFEVAFAQIALAIEKDPQNKNYYQKLVWMSQSADKLKQAQELIESTLAKNQENDVLRRSLGLAYLLERNYQLAIKNLEASLRLNEKEKTTHFLLGCSFLGLLEKSKDDLSSQSELLESALQEFQKSEKLPVFEGDSDFQEGMRYLEEKSFSKSWDKMESVLQRIKELQVEPLSFSHLALSFLMDVRGVDQYHLDTAIDELKERYEQGKNYPQINNHLGLCFLIFWRKLISEAINQLRLAVEKDARFQKAKTNLIFLESAEKRISALLKDLKF
jgi:tetratricopeptide (TPR) repeat protein